MSSIISMRVPEISRFWMILKIVYDRSLVVDVIKAQNGGPKNYPTAEQMIGWLEELRHVSFHGLSEFTQRNSNDNHKWEFLSHILTHCKKIRQLEMDGSAWDVIYLTTILKLPSVPTLEKLTIRGLAAEADLVELETKVRSLDRSFDGPQNILFGINKTNTQPSIVAPLHLLTSLSPTTLLAFKWSLFFFNGPIFSPSLSSLPREAGWALSTFPL